MDGATADCQEATWGPAPRERARPTLVDPPVDASSATGTLIFQPFPRARLAVSVRLQAGPREYLLRDALRLDVEHTPDGHVLVRSAVLELEGEARSVAGALDDFAMSFDVQYRALVEREPERLTRYAARLRERFERAVAHVRER